MFVESEPPFKFHAPTELVSGRCSNIHSFICRQAFHEYQYHACSVIAPPHTVVGEVFDFRGAETRF